MCISGMEKGQFRLQVIKTLQKGQGMIDLNTIKKGTDYTRLPQSFVIFICTFHAFEKGKWNI